MAKQSAVERNHYLLRVANSKNHVGSTCDNRLVHSLFVPKGAAGGQTFAEKEEQQQQQQQPIDALISQGNKLWQLCQDLIERGQAKNDDEAVAHWVDLQASSDLQNNSTTVQKRTNEIAEELGRKRSLMSRVKKAALLKSTCDRESPFTKIMFQLREPSKKSSEIAAVFWATNAK